MKRYEENPTISTSAYAANDAVTGLESISVGEHGFIDRIVVKDADAESAALDILFFRDTITAAAANAAFTLSDDDADKLIGKVSFSSYYNPGGVSGVAISEQNNIGLAFDLATSSTNDYKLYYQVVTSGTPTYTATDDLKFDIYILDDGDL